VEEGEECSDSEGSHNEEAKEPDKTNKKEGEKTDKVGVGKAYIFVFYHPHPSNRNFPEFI
jgi:hypothetical protein